MNRGFTIVELVIVIIVISILVALAGGAAAKMLDSSRTAESKSKMTILKSALEKYYAKNNEYPSAAQLAGGYNGRSLPDSQYTAIATLLGVNKDVLTNGYAKFMPCANGSNLCCTTDAAGECPLLSTDTRYITYLTRSAADVAAGNVTRTFKAYISGCTYTFPAPNLPAENGYTAYFLIYHDLTDPEWWTAARVHTSDKGDTTRGDWCVVNKQN